jgi:hypothetical protein
VYRYYISSSLQQGGKPSSTSDIIQRIPGPALEEHLAEALARLVPEHSDTSLHLPKRVEVHSHSIHVLLDARLTNGLACRLEPEEIAAPDPAKPQPVRVELPVRTNWHSNSRYGLKSKPRKCGQKIPQLGQSAKQRKDGLELRQTRPKRPGK